MDQSTKINETATPPMEISGQLNKMQENQSEPGVSEEHCAPFRPQENDANSVIRNKVKQMIYLKASEDCTKRNLLHKLNLMQKDVRNLKTMSESMKLHNNNLGKEAAVGPKLLERYEQLFAKATKLTELVKAEYAEVETQLKTINCRKILNEANAQADDIKNAQSLQKITVNVDVEQKLAQAKSEKVLNREKLSQCENILSINEQNVAKMQQLIQDVEADVETLLAQKKATENKLANVMTEDGDNLSTTLKERIEMGENTRQTKSEELLDFKKQFDAAQEKVLSLKDELLVASDRGEILSIELEQAAAEEAKISDSLREQEAENAQLQQDYENNMHALRQDYEAAKKQVQEMEASSTQLLQLNMDLLKEQAEWNNKYTESFIARENMCSLLSENQKDLDKNIAVCATRMQEITTLENEMQQLQSEHKTLNNEINFKNSELVSEQKRIEKAQADSESRNRVAQEEFVRTISELSKKKEYLMESRKYLEGQMQGLLEKFEKAQQGLDKEQQTAANLHRLVASKRKLACETNAKLVLLKSNEQSEASSLKSLFKPPKAENQPLDKKVQFNEELFFKSATESEEYSLPVTSSRMDFVEWAKSQTTASTSGSAK